MSRQRQKGSSFERDGVEYMRRRLGDDRIERRVMGGANDRGDVAGIYIHGERCVVEMKNHARMELAAWVDEAEAERMNDDAGFKAVLHHRKGMGAANFGRNYVTMELDDFLAIVAGNRGLLDGPQGVS